MNKQNLELHCMCTLHNPIYIRISTHENTGIHLGLKYHSSQTQAQVSTCTCTGHIEA